MWCLQYLWRVATKPCFDTGVKPGSHIWISSESDSTHRYRNEEPNLSWTSPKSSNGFSTFASSTNTKKQLWRSEFAHYNWIGPVEQSNTTRVRSCVVYWNVVQTKQSEPTPSRYTQVAGLFIDSGCWRHTNVLLSDRRLDEYSSEMAFRCLYSWNDGMIKFIHWMDTISVKTHQLTSRSSEFIKLRLTMRETAMKLSVKYCTFYTPIQTTDWMQKRCTSHEFTPHQLYDMKTRK